MFGQVIIAAPGLGINIIKLLTCIDSKYVACIGNILSICPNRAERALYVHVAFISTYSILYLNYFVLIKTASTEPEIPIHQRHDESKNVITAVHVVLCKFYGPILNEVIKQWPRSKSQLQI